MIGFMLSKHMTNAMQKLGVKGRSQAVVELLRMGELEL
jgi:LuxR family transcriptional regulator, transcriptional regulator of spore coat protein